jgi:hypothetical protein
MQAMSEDELSVPLHPLSGEEGLETTTAHVLPHQQVLPEGVQSTAPFAMWLTLQALTQNKLMKPLNTPFA